MRWILVLILLTGECWAYTDCQQFKDSATEWRGKSDAFKATGYSSTSIQTGIYADHSMSLYGICQLANRADIQDSQIEELKKTNTEIYEELAALQKEIESLKNQSTKVIGHKVK